MIRTLGIVLTTLISTGLADAEPALRDYVVRKGDSCSAIAKRVWGDRRVWRRINAANPSVCGAQPYVLTPGMVLRLPLGGSEPPETAEPAAPRETVTSPESAAAPTGPDAKVTSVLRQVEARSADAPGWSRAAQGTGLYRGWRVSTGEESAAELTFRDTSLLQMRADALVIIFGQSSNDARRQAPRARLERGALRSRLAELAGGPGLVLETAAAEATLGAGTSLVSVDAAGTSRVANHAGAPVQLEAAGARVQVPAGMGSKVVKGQRPTKPRPLPAPPAWADAPQRITPGSPLQVRWQPVEGAARYRIEISREPHGHRPVAAARVHGDKDSFSLPLDAGRYHVRLSAIDADEFEGRASEERVFELLPQLVVLPGGGAPSGAEPWLVPMGARVQTPAGMRCGFGEALGPEPVIFERPGAQAVRCVDADGAPAAEVTVNVAPVRAKVEDMPRRIKKGQPVEFTLRLLSAAPVPSAVTLDGPAAFNFSIPVSTGPGVFRVKMAPSEGVPRSPVIVRADGAAVSRFNLSFGLPTKAP